jgi:hypothetical protein
MDWKYKHFHQERVFAEPLDLVIEAARAYMTQSLGWQITETAEGFDAEGSSFAHRATADVRFYPVAGGTRLTVDLSVSRAGSLGFMLFDVGGYYNIQIRKWLDGIQWTIHRKINPGEENQNPPVPTTNKAAGCVFNGCLAFIVVMAGLYFLIMLISAVVGVITGNLYLVGRGGTSELHGIWARIVAVGIFAAGEFITLRIRRRRY